MERRLQIQIDNRKVVKNGDGNDVELLFSLVLPYGIPFPMAREALDELVSDFNEMEKAAEELKQKAAAEQAQSAPVEENK